MHTRIYAQSRDADVYTTYSTVSTQRLLCSAHSSPRTTTTAFWRVWRFFQSAHRIYVTVELCEIVCGAMVPREGRTVRRMLEKLFDHLSSPV